MTAAIKAARASRFQPVPQMEAPAVRVLQSAVTWGIPALLIFSVLAFGGVEPWSIFIFQSGAAALALMWLIAGVLRGAIEVRFNLLMAPMALFAAVLAIQVLAGTSIYPYATRTETMQYVAYGLLFLVATQVLDTYKARTNFVASLTAFGFLLAIFALFQHYNSNGKIYWVHPTEFEGVGIFGPYANHNHYAGLMEMLTPMPIVLALSRRRAVEKRLMLLLAGVLMASTVFLSGSRGGMIAMAAELVFLGLVQMRHRGRAGLPVLIVVAVCTMAALIWLGDRQIVQHIRTLEHSTSAEVSGNRLIIARDGLRMFRDHPWLGFGLATFPVAYPQYRSFTSPLFINEAHNDYIQVLVETGLVGFTAVIAFLALLYRQGFRNMQRREGSRSNAAVLAALTGCTGLLVHSFSDFNLHLTANAAAFYVLCALATTELNPMEGVAWAHQPPPVRHRDVRTPVIVDYDDA